jgi:amicyanin
MGMMHSAPASAPGPAPAPASTAPVAGDAVNIDNFAFAPATLTVKTGSTVTWTNHDQEPHSVVAENGAFHSPMMDTGAAFSYTFASAGSFEYACGVHPFMRATVVVTP